jgi:pilus assembly protein CpaF
VSVRMRVDPQLVRRLQLEAGTLLGAEQRRRRHEGRPELFGEDERQLGRQLISQVITQYRAELVEAGNQPPSSDYERALAEAIEARQFGAGNLQHLLDNPDIENIDINGYDNVFVTYAGGRRERGEPVADSDADFIEQVQVLAAHAGLSSRPFDQANPQLDLRLPDGSRLSAIMGNSPRPSISIRRHRYMKASLSELLGTNTMTQEVADFLAAAVKARLNVIIAGATNAGKTTLLRALTNEIEPHERIITIEKALEIGLGKDPEAHPNIVELEESLPNAEGHGGVSMADLLRRTLRMNPDRVIVGEVLGPEIVTMLNAMSQGNEGSLSTLHARSARATFDRIGVYAKQAAENLDLESTAQLISSGLDLVVFVQKIDDAGTAVRRSVCEILEVGSFDGASVSASALFVDDGAGTAVRNLNVPVSDHRLSKLIAAGWTDTPVDQGWR